MCKHLREITASDGEKYLICACTDSEHFLEHTGDETDCNDCIFGGGN